MKRKLLHRVGMAALATSVAINTAVPAMAVEASGSNSGEITSFAGEGEPTDEGEPTEEGEPTGEGEPADEGEPTEEGEPTGEGEPADEGEPTEEGEPTGEGEPADEGEPTEEGEPTDGKTPTDNIKIPEPTDILTNSVLLVQPLSNESDFVISDDGVLTGYNGSDTDVVIPDSVTKIGDRAFYNNTTIESVTIPSSVAEIGSNAFGACSNLATINFSSDENLKTIGDDAFMNTAVESLSIPEGVETIGDTALYGTNLKSVFLPSTLTKLGNSSVSGAFSSSSRSASPILTEITIASGNSVYKSVDNGIYSADGKTIYYYPAAGTGNYTIDSGTETIDDGAFRSSKLSEVIIPEGVETIGANSFDSSSITSLSLPSTVKTIGDAAFYGASSLAKVELNEGLETIGSDAFGYIAATDLTIPSTVALIESPALDETIVLPVGSKITFLGKNTVIESGAIATYREVTICGYEDSTAQEYVENQGSSGKLKFEVLGSSATVQVTAVNINKTSLEMTVNGTEQLTAKVEPDNATNKNVTWTVEQTGNVVEVDSSTGKVKAVGVGSATIKAIAQNGIYGSCSVTVKEASQADGFVIENGVLKSYTGTDSSITIPDTVTVIGDGETSVLSGNSTVLSVTIPTSVTEIAKNAFSGATALTQITFQDGSKLTKIGDNAFNGAYVESISIPEGVTEIGAEAFLNAHQLKSVYFPSTVTEFGDGGISALFAAENASPRSLEEITIGDGNSVYMTYDGVVYSNDGETLIYCPPARTKTLAVKEGTKTIAPRAVYKSSITSLILNEGLESISEYAFGHSKITELTVPASVKTIDDYAFYFSQITSVTLNEGLETIGKSVFYADNLFGLEIPSSVKSVGSELLTFENGKGKDCWVKINGRNTTLAEGFIPDIWPSSGITVYGYADSTADKYVKERREADEKCVITFKSIDDFVPVESVKVTPSSGTLKRTETLQLKVDVLPQGSQGTTTSYKSSDTSVATVDKNGLITAVQPGKAKITVSVSGKTAECQIEVVKADGESDFTINEKGEITAFIGADITNLVIPSDVNGTAVTGIAQGAFANNGDIKTVVIPANVKTIGQGAFKNCSGITQITIAQGVESIGNEAFMGLSALSEIKIPEGITTIPKDCFNSCTSLTKIELPSSLKTIEEEALRMCSSLTTLTLNEGLVEIKGEALLGVPISTLHLPSTLTTIREGAFQGKDDGSTNSLTEIYIPSTVTLIEPEAFAHREKSLTIITDSYTSAAAEYANENGFNLKLEAEVNLEDFVIDENGVLTEYKGTKRDITLPDTVKIIGEGVFAEEEGSTFNLKSIVIPSSVTEIRKDAFNGSSVEEVVFAPSSNLETIGESAFAYCTKLPSIKLPSSLKTIGERAFDGASLLEGISVPSSVESIGDYAFNVCTELRYVDFSDNSSLKTIGDGAFYNCFRLTEINVPEGVEEIGDYAFRISQGLTKLTLPSTLTKFGSSVPAVFGDLKSATLTATDSLTEIEIAFGNTVYMSHNGAVYSADGKTLLYVPSGKTGTVDILEGTESIGEYSFMRSKSNHVNIPETVKSIGKNAFVSSSLTSVEIPSSVESIAEYAFFNCSGLNSVTLVEGLKTIGYGAFMETDLTGVTVPASLESMEEGAFDSLPNGGYFKVNGMETAFNGSVIPYYREITVYGHAGSTSEEYVNSQKATYGSCKLIFEPIDNYVEVEEIVLSDDYLELNRFDTYKLSFEVKPENATYSGITFKSLNTSVATVDKDGNITAVSAGETTIQAISPDGATAQCLVKVISDGTESDFIIIDGLITGYRGSEKEIVIPDEINGVKVEGIADKAFYNNDNIISVVMPEGLKTIGKMAFADCGNLSLVEFNSDLESIGENAFYNCGTLKSVSLPEGLKSMERGVFEMCEQLMYADIPSSLKEIPEDTFNYDWRLKEIIIPEGVEIIGKRAFYECEGAERLVISSTVKTIGEEAFVANVRLKEIIIPEGVETIEQKAFMSCTAVTTVSLPSTLKTMGGSYAGNVFEGDGTVGCENMEVITVADENPYFASKDGLLYNSDLSEIIFCPRGRTEAVVADSVTKIADNAFFFCKKLEKVTLPDGITEIGESAFQDCISLESLKLPESLVTIGDSAFGDCYVLKELSLPNNVETIGNYAVSSTSISEISIPNSVKYLGNHAFSGNTSLKSIYIPSTVLEIGEYCLQGCAVDLVITTDYKNSAAYRYAVDNNIAVNVLNSSSGSNGEDESDQSYSGGSSGSGGSLSNISSEDESQNSVEIVTSGVLSESEAASAVSKAAENDSKQIAINSSSNFATMPRAMIESVLSETSANIVVKTSDGTVAVLKDTLKNLSAYDAITVGIDGGRVYVSSNGEYLSGIGEIIITVPYKENETTGNVAVEITKDNGEKIIVENVYDGNGSITFSADGTVDFVIIDDYKAESESSVTENPFKDIDGHWAENAILAAYEKGIFSGTGNDTFSPDDNITRGMIASAVYRMSGGTEDGTSGFNDVKTDAYYSKAVAWGSKNGIFSGYENGLFQPEKEITREEMALIAYKYALYGGKDISAETTELFQNFSDSNEISDWSKEAINYCVEAGIMSGRTDGTFDPKGKATRAEAAGVLTSLLSNMQDL